MPTLSDSLENAANVKKQVSLSPSRSAFSIEWIATLAILAVYLIWVLSLPAFPSQDGPAHLYFVYVMHALLGHSDPLLARFFTIKHIAPPYSLYYYALMLLSRVVPFLVADRLVIAAYFISFVFGFRFLARTIGPAADRATLLATILLVNWPLGMGFVNYCLSLSLSFWALGLWFRMLEKPRLPLRVGFVLLAVTMMMTHPVPFLVTMGVCGASLLLQLIRSRKAAHLPGTIVTYLAAASCVIYIKLFVNAVPLQQPMIDSESFLHRVINRARIFSRGTGVNPFVDASHAIFVYRKGITLILVVALAVSLLQLFRNRKRGAFTTGDFFCVLSVLLAVLLPFLPPVLNGSSFFAERLLIFVWLFALMAASGSTLLAQTPGASPAGSSKPSPLAISLTLIAFMVVLHLTFLHRVDTILRPLGRQVAILDGASIGHTSQTGLVIDQRAWNIPYVGPAWDPYFWAAADLFRKNNDVLINSPWLNLAIIPLGSTPTLDKNILTPQIEDAPYKLRDILQTSPVDRKSFLAAADFVVLLSDDRTREPRPDPLFAAEPGTTSPWTCHAGAVVWYQVCDRTDSANK